MGGHWKEATAPDGRPAGWYLVDAVALRRVFREWCVLFHHEHELHFGTNRPRIATEIG